MPYLEDVSIGEVSTDSTEHKLSLLFSDLGIETTLHNFVYTQR